jgi:EAL domain-containing protein (putative c-di-GMP-specific phosphodiesterase class I)
MHGDDNEQKIAFFNIEMSKQKIWERKVEDDMERALMNKEFQVYLQPKFSTGEETLGGAEALVRWIHPTEGFVPPNRFIPIFEQNGFILKLDDFMLEEVAKQQAKWISEGWQVVPISVNVSRAHFTREDLAEHISEIVDRYQVPHEVIELELTESAFFDDKEMLLSTVKKLRDAGFSVSMDDFGAGYSSLNSLKELSLDVLKIDADFFRGSDSLERGMLIVTEVINLAKKLNMKIVAEGIESREQVDFLKEQECDLIQGYYFAKPMPLSEFEKNYKNV